MKPAKIKPLIAPLQHILLQKGKCVGCFTSLKQGRQEQIHIDEIKIVCRCNRIYIYLPKQDIYRRASFEEVDNRKKE